MALRLAFAVNSKGNFKNNHFGDARKYLIYEQQDEQLVLVETLENQFRVFDEKHGHGWYRKAQLIIQYLKDNKVNALVAMQFGRNIGMVSEHFVPVIIYSEQLNEVVEVLKKHLHWIEDEWNKKKKNHSLFYIKSGILKKDLK
ncbi:MAG: hypothetical protein L3J74_09435 [Bacteroidales bacterium]|nr:hypothetical protein [Bacteroidales bacterium]